MDDTQPVKKKEVKRGYIRASDAPIFDEPTQKFIDELLDISYSNKEMIRGVREKFKRNSLWIKWHFAGLSLQGIVNMQQKPRVTTRAVDQIIKRFLDRLSPTQVERYFELRRENQLILEKSGA